MKKIFYILLIIQTAFFTSGCKKNLESEGVSKLSVKITLNGNTLMAIPQGSTFVDPGYTAIDGNTKADVTSKVKVDGTVDDQTIGYYEIIYSAVNSDGISISTLRQVIVYDPNAPKVDISGAYSSKVKRISPSRSFVNLSVNITKLAPGFFSVTDFLGGFYDQGSNYLYGPAFGFSGYMQLNSDNTITLISNYSPGWGGSLDDFANGVYYPATQKVSWDAFVFGYHYVVTLSLVE